ncbi:MAG: type I-B CRISPR-associated protein Cas7/Cst2/DevR [Bacillaceae bacterium]|nr:type I-B CRISPR-associated protein Cas7/Cst2/DevR [Bacillaceae bacterium]
MGKSLTFTAVFQSGSLNYGEGMANISELKKMHRGNGDVYTFASRQSLRYDIVRLGNQFFGWNLDTVEKQKGGVVQFKKDVTIEDSVEMDLFGYLKTDKSSLKRPAVARLSHAISLEPYKSDLEFLNNMGLAERIGETANLANIEHHQSFFTYTLTIDLDRVGVDGDLELPNEVRKQRVLELLEILKVLSRDIRGRRENLSPQFTVGGVYPVSNPFFMGRIKLMTGAEGVSINPEPIKSVLDMTFMGEPIKEMTRIGSVDGVFLNNSIFEDMLPGQTGTIEAFFNYLKDEVTDYYEE